MHFLYMPLKIILTLENGPKVELYIIMSTQWLKLFVTPIYFTPTNG